MNVTIISLVFPPETGSARRTSELAESLASQGNQVAVVTGFPSYPKGSVYAGYRKKIFEKSRWAGSVDLIRVWLYTSPNRHSSYHRILHYVTFTVMSVLGGLLAPKPAVVYVISPPYFLGLSGWIVACLRGARLAFDVQDFWPEAPIALEYVKHNWLIRILIGLERFIYQRSDVIFVLSAVMREKILERGISVEKIEVVYNWVDLVKFAPRAGDTVRLAHGWVERFIVLFAGNMGRAQGLDAVVDAAEQLREYPDIVFVMLGDGIERARLIERAKSLELLNLRFIDAVPEDQVPPYLGMADVLLVTLGRAKHREAALPSKIQVYMASAKPILVAAEGAAAQVIEQARGGIVVAPDDPTSLAEAVLRLRTMSKMERQALGTNAREYAEKHFDRAQQCRRIALRLEDIAGRVR
jgi:colanic acid biosynthesis glycosyl transferase WcaI